MTAQSLLSSTILKRVMTVFLFVLTQKRVMAPSNDNMLGLMRVMCGTRVTLLSFGTREYGPMGLEGLVGASESRNNLLRPSTHLQMLNMSHSSFSIWKWNCLPWNHSFYLSNLYARRFPLKMIKNFNSATFYVGENLVMWWQFVNQDIVIIILSLLVFFFSHSASLTE